MICYKKWTSMDLVQLGKNNGSLKSNFFNAFWEGME